VTRFDEDGYAPLPGLLGPDEVAAARSGVSAALHTPGAAACERPNNTLVPVRWDDPLVGLVVARSARIAATVCAGDLRWISGYVSSKAAHSAPLWWHQDWWCWDHQVTLRPAAPQIAVLCYLSDTDREHGALRVLPGSHRHSAPLHAELPEAHAAAADELAADHPALRDDPAQVTIAARAGDAVVLDYRLLHGTHANSAPTRRDCLLLTFAPDWAALPADVRAHLIRHPCLPAPDEHPAADLAVTRLLPRFDGVARDLPLSRNAPREFAIAGA
jgi:hypothetical protein